MKKTLIILTFNEIEATPKIYDKIPFDSADEVIVVDGGSKDGTIEWVAVRPDSLTNEDKVTEYELYSSPIRSAIFDAGKTSRINVGHFMADLITENDIWRKWKGQMPVIYNKTSK